MFSSFESEKDKNTQKYLAEVRTMAENMWYTVSVADDMKNSEMMLIS